MEEKTKLPTSLAIAVATELRDKHGIDHWGSGILNSKFSADELSKITKLELNDPVSGSCEGIELLPNLCALYIESTGRSEYKQAHMIASIGDKDVLSIEKCKNLTSLKIVNQANISDINLSDMPNLYNVDISRNNNLESISGIDKLPELSLLTCYGNKSLQEVKGLDKAIAQGKELEKLNLDVLLFPKAIDYRYNGNYNQDAVNKMAEMGSDYRGVNWLESFGDNKKIRISHNQMLKMHNKACTILAENVTPNTGVRDTVVAVERYLAENVVYDDESLKYGHTKMIESTNGLKMVDGPNNGANGAFNCIMKNSCVCEGYTRGEQYLLALKGIKTSNVRCIAGADTMGMADSKKKDDRNTSYNMPSDGYHSIVRVSDIYNLYSDPCWNAGSYQSGDKSMPYSLLTKGEIAKTHTLSFEERKVNDALTKVERTEIAESLKYNAAFRNTKASEISQQRRDMKQPVRGQILKNDGKSYG